MIYLVKIELIQPIEKFLKFLRFFNLVVSKKDGELHCKRANAMQCSSSRGALQINFRIVGIL